MKSARDYFIEFNSETIRLQECVCVTSSLKVDESRNPKSTQMKMMSYLKTKVRIFNIVNILLTSLLKLTLNLHGLFRSSALEEAATKFYTCSTTEKRRRRQIQPILAIYFLHFCPIASPKAYNLPEDLFSPELQDLLSPCHNHQIGN